MTDAVLSFTVKSDQAKQAAVDLDKLEQSAKKAERAAIEWGDKSATAATKVTKASTAATQMGSSLKQVEVNARQAARGLDLAGGVFEELAAGLHRTLGPAALAGAAFTVVASAAHGMFQSLRPQVKTADDILREHEKNILRLGDAYDVVNEKKHRYASDTANTANARNEGTFKEFRGLVSGQIKAIFDEVYKTIGAGGGNQGPLKTVLASQFKPFESALDHLAEEARKKLPDLRAIQDEITNIAKADPKGLNSTRDLLLGMLDAVSENAAKLPELARQISDVTDIVDQFQRQLDGVDSDLIKKALQEIFDKALDGKKGIGDILIEIAKLEQANPAFTNIINAFKGLIESAAATEAALDKVGQKYFAGTGGSPNGRRAPEVWLPDTAPTPDKRPSVEDFYAKRDKALAKAARAPNPYRDLIKSADDRIKQMQVELDLMGQVGVAADTLRNYQELLSRATDHGRKIGEKQKQELHDRAEEMAKLAEATQAAQMAQDLLFERAQMFRSPIEQRVHGDLRNAGIDPDSAAGQRLATQIRLNEQLQISADLTKDFASSFVSDMLNGKSAIEALTNALSQLADKLLDMALDSAINALFGNLLGATGGGFTDGAGGGLGALLGYRNGGAFAGGVQMFANGGAFTNSVVSRPTLFPFANGTGLMGEAGPEAIMPLNRDSSGRLGVSAANVNQRQAANDGIQADIRVFFDENGNLDAKIERISQKNVKAGLSQYDKGSAYRTSRDLGTVSERGYVG